MKFIFTFIGISLWASSYCMAAWPYTYPSQKGELKVSRKSDRIDVRIYQLDSQTTLVGVQQKAFRPDEIKQALNAFEKGPASVRKLSLKNAKCLEKTDGLKLLWACEHKQDLYLMTLQSKSHDHLRMVGRVYARSLNQ